VLYKYYHCVYISKSIEYTAALYDIHRCTKAPVTIQTYVYVLVIQYAHRTGSKLLIHT